MDAAVEREATGQEDPFQQWIDVSGKDYGVAILCEGKYGYDAVGSEIRLTLLRSPSYALHDPRKVEPGELYRFMDQGEQEIRLRIVPHEGGWREAGIPRLAEVFANPPVTVITTAHPGHLPSSGSFLRVEPENVILGAVKVAEDGEDLVIRLYESVGRRTQATVIIGVRPIQVTLDPHELKSLRLSPDGSVAETDLLERID